jgi:hypothetical protein
MVSEIVDKMVKAAGFPFGSRITENQLPHNAQE